MQTSRVRHAALVITWLASETWNPSFLTSSMIWGSTCKTWHPRNDFFSQICYLTWDDCLRCSAWGQYYPQVIAYCCLQKWEEGCLSCNSCRNRMLGSTHSSIPRGNSSLHEWGEIKAASPTEWMGNPLRWSLQPLLFIAAPSLQGAPAPEEERGTHPLHNLLCWCARPPCTSGSPNPSLPCRQSSVGKEDQLQRPKVMPWPSPGKISDRHV